MKILPDFLASRKLGVLPNGEAGNFPVVHFIATGGTIAMKIDPVTKAVVPAISGDDLMQSVPDAGQYANIVVNNFSKMSANYITNEWWADLTEILQDYY